MSKKKLCTFTGAALVFCFSLFSSPSHSSEICFVNNSGVNIEARWVTRGGQRSISGGVLRPGGNTACTELLELFDAPNKYTTAYGIYRVLGSKLETLPMISQFPMPNGLMYNTWSVEQDGLVSLGNGALTVFDPIIGPVDVYLGGDVNPVGYASNLPRFVGMGLGVYGQRLVVMDGPQKGGDGVYRLNIRDIPLVPTIIPNPLLDPTYMPPVSNKPPIDPFGGKPNW